MKVLFVLNTKHPMLRSVHRLRPETNGRADG